MAGRRRAEGRDAEGMGRGAEEMAEGEGGAEEQPFVTVNGRRVQAPGHPGADLCALCERDHFETRLPT